MKRTVFGVVVLFLFSGISTAQDIIPSEKFLLNFDYARFRNDAISGYVEMYYSFYPNQLTYHFNGKKYCAGIKLSTTLVDNKTNTTIVSRKGTLRIEEADTSGAWFKFPTVSQSGFAVPFGEYTLQVVAADSLGANRSDSLAVPLSVREFATHVTTSDLELCQNIKASTQKNDLFYKNSLEVIPNPALVFGVTTHPVIFSYIEIYNLDPNALYTLKTVVANNTGEVVREAKKTKKFASTNALEIGTTTVTAYPSGKFSFHFLVLDKNENALASTAKTCYIYNPHLQGTAAATVKSYKEALATLSMKQLDDEFQKLLYFTTIDESQMYAQVSSAEGKREFLNNLWVSIAQGRMDKAPISRDEYLQRVEVANKRYRAFSKEGWHSDRGRVFILYGTPDDIERIPSEGGEKPYEIWRYYKLDNGVEFIFVDRSGFGDYDLVHSTKRGELSDTSWQRYLR